MKKTSIAAVNRILNGKSNPCDKLGFWFVDQHTGKFGVTDSFCCVMYDSNIDLSGFDMADSPYLKDGYESPFPTDVSRLFNPFNNEFHEWYSDEHMDNIPVKEIIEQSKEAKKNKKDDSQWYNVNKYGIHYNIELMRAVCEALDCKTVGIYYPANPIDVKYYKPIVIIGDTGIGLVMPIKQ